MLRASNRVGITSRRHIKFMKIYDEEETIISRPLPPRETANAIVAAATTVVTPNGSSHTPSHDSQDAPQVSIFLPVYNEEESLTPLHIKIDAALATLNRTVEVIYVDDGSTDKTIDVLREIERRDPRVRVISFRRNYGKMAAMVAAIDVARAPVLVSLDADMQNDPADIARLLLKLDEGFDVVSGWRFKRQDKYWTRKFPSMLANKLISNVSGVSLHDYGCCLKAYRREALEGIGFYGEMHRFIPIYCAHLNGAKIAELPVQHHPRTLGVSKFGKLSRTFEVVLDLITIRFMENYRTKPMHLIGFAGLVAFAVTGISLLAALFSYLAGSTLLAASLFIIACLGVGFGALFVALGLIAEMLMRSYYEAQGKATYTVRERLGFDDSSAAEATTEREAVSPARHVSAVT